MKCREKIETKKEREKEREKQKERERERRWIARNSESLIIHHPL